MPDFYWSSTAAATALSASVTPTQTTITVGSVTGYPTLYPWVAVIDRGTPAEELVKVTGGSGTSLTVERGFDGTTKLAHTAGAVFEHGVSAKALDDLYALKDAAATKTGTETLANKTLTAPAFTGTATGLSSLGGAWTDFPLTVVQGFSPYSVTARHFQIGRLLHVAIRFNINSASADLVMNLPVVPRAPWNELGTPLGTAIASVNGVAYYIGVPMVYPGTGGSFAVHNGDGTALWGTGLGWTTGSWVSINMCYEVP